MKTVKTLLSFWTVALLLILNAWTQEAQESNSVNYEAFPDFVPIEMEVVFEKPQIPICLGFKQAFQEGRNVYELRTVTAEDITMADKEFEERFGHVWPGPARVGLVRTIEPVPLSVNDRFAERIELPDRRNLWTFAIRSPEAYGIRVHFTNFDMGAGSLLIYARDGEQLIVRGPYSGKGPNRNGDFWTPSLPGETVFIEVTGIEEPHLEISEIVHFDWNPTDLHHGAKAPAELPCHLDVMCYNDPPVSLAARQATVHMIWPIGSPGCCLICTGTLLNDLDEDTYVPYFLTAYHCLRTQADVSALEVVFFWQHDSCDGSLPNFWSLPRMTGGTLLETNPTNGGNDMTFIRLDGSLPGGAWLAGWTTGSLPATFVGIHHPDGSWKRVTFLHEHIIVSCDTSLTHSNYHYCEQDSGITEPGSSGSGIFDDGGRVMGQLYGVCYPAGLNTGCDNRDEYNDVYGKFSVTYPIIRRWLEIGGTIYVDGIYVGEELGTPSKPFNTVGEANNFAWDGSRIKIKSGSYPETLTFTKQLTVLAEGGVVTIGE